MTQHEEHTLLLSTRNPGKIREYVMMLSEALPSNWTFANLADFPKDIPDVIEDRDTFVGNAIKKALENAQQTHMCCMSEDSGLAVDALDGAPGVYSARFANNQGDEANNDLLLEKLEDTPDDQRSARYIAILCLALPNNTAGHALAGALGFDWANVTSGEPETEGVPGKIEDHVLLWFRGEVEGSIIRERRGEGGFGYDPLFLVSGLQETMAQISAEHKNTISHRANALKKLNTAFESS